MSKNIKQYDLLISCPGDVESEIGIIDDVVNQFNVQYSDVLGIIVRTKHWSNSSYAQSGAKPQELLNKQFINDCDAAVAIFWTRFGSPTDKFGSGTEEEINNMLATGKQVFMYFSDKPIAPTLHDKIGYEKTKEFKSKYESKGLYSTYQSDEEFRKKFFAHLSQYFLSKASLDEIHTQSKLVVKSISKCTLHDIAQVSIFQLNSHASSKKMLQVIQNLYSHIDSIKLGKSRTIENKSIKFQMNKFVEIDENIKEYISNAAEIFDFQLSEKFFQLGNLKENLLAGISLSPLINREQSLEGTVAEKEKYEKIFELKDLITDIMNWTPVEDTFKNMKCLYLAIENEGNSFDEDIDISLMFNDKMLIMHDEISMPPCNSLKYICEDCYLDTLFKIESSVAYRDYISSKKLPEHNSYTPAGSGMALFQRDYEEEYLDDLNNAFDYDYYRNDNELTVNVHFDYIKQHTAVAFPTPIFITNEIDNIEYKITSKNNPEIITGILLVKSFD